MRRLLILILYVLSSNMAVGQILSIIEDPDGYTNVRAGKGTQFKVVGKIIDGQIFYHDGLLEDSWYPVYVRNEDEYLEGFVHKSRIRELKSLPVVGVKKAIPGGRQITGDGIDFKLTLKSFDKDEHQCTLEEDKWVVRIDGVDPLGVDGAYPNKEIDEFTLKIDGQLIAVPSNHYSDAYELNLSSLKVHRSSSGHMFISTSNSDGAGYYDLVWIVKDGKFLNRFVGVI